MDLTEKIQFWKNEIDRAEQYGYYFDSDSIKEVVDTVEDLSNKSFTETELKIIITWFAIVNSDYPEQTTSGEFKLAKRIGEILNQEKLINEI